MSEDSTKDLALEATEENFRIMLMHVSKLQQRVIGDMHECWENIDALNLSERTRIIKWLHEQFRNLVYAGQIKRYELEDQITKRRFVVTVEVQRRYKFPIYLTTAVGHIDTLP